MPSFITINFYSADPTSVQQQMKQSMELEMKQSEH